MTEPGQRTLGRYELLRRVAAGGMGEIFLAKMRGTAGFEKRVIIKTILGHLAEEEEFVEKFLDEGRIVVELTHGNIVPVFDMGEEDGEYFIAMDYVPGRDLRGVLKKLSAEGRSMQTALAVFVAAEICKGLDYAHRKVDTNGRPLHLVHRDISPSNVLLSKSGEVKLIDFGIARATNKLSRTVSGRIQGKFCYMSPEQASGQLVDARSDVFSVGVVLYEMLTGSRPFEGESDLESLELVRQGAFTPLRELDEGFDEAIEALVAKALARERGARYQSAEDLHLDLLNYLFGAGTPVTSTMLARLLDELYPEGVERPELASALRPAKPMSLDDALSLELDALGGLEPIDPMGATATETPGASRHTATLSVPSPQPSEPSEASEASEPEEDEPSAEDTSSVVTSSVGSAIDEAGITSPPGILVAEDAGSGPSGRALAALALLALVGAAIAWYAWPRDPVPVSMKLETNPAGASVYIDGAARLGVVTPATVPLEPGTHTVRFELEGYDSSGAVALIVPEDASRTHAFPKKGPFALEPATRSRDVIIETRPAGASVSIGDDALGKAPVVVRLDEGQRRHVRVSAPGCTARIYTLDDTTRERATFNLSCEAEPRPPEDAGTPPEKIGSTPKPSERPARPRTLDVTLDSEPTGALVSVDGAAPKKTPLELSGVRADRVLSLVYTLSGYADAKAKVRASSRRHVQRLEELPTGCVTITLSAPPLVAHVSIDGAKIRGKATRDGMVEGVKGRRVPSGEHTVRVWNEAAGKERVERVTVRPGGACVKIRAW